MDGVDVIVGRALLHLVEIGRDIRIAGVAFPPIAAQFAVGRAFLGGEQN